MRSLLLAAALTGQWIVPSTPIIWVQAPTVQAQAPTVQTLPAYNPPKIDVDSLIKEYRERNEELRQEKLRLQTKILQLETENTQLKAELREIKFR